jgi:hypothetical protein
MERAFCGFAMEMEQISTLYHSFLESKSMISASRCFASPLLSSSVLWKLKLRKRELIPKNSMPPNPESTSHDRQETRPFVRRGCFMFGVNSPGNISVR